MQNFTPISEALAKKSVTVHKNKVNEKQTVNLVSDPILHVAG